MAKPISSINPWSCWHERLHKQLLADPELLPLGAALLVAVSGGQDSMAMLRLLLDLKRLHEWKLYIWHGNHCWHSKSSQIACELQKWCEDRQLPFYLDKAANGEANTETKARNWRYQNLLLRAQSISTNDQEISCDYVLTAHTASDRTETFLINLIRGSDLPGLCSLKEKRSLNHSVQLIRPLLSFSREETQQICQDLQLPVWIDPSNTNKNLVRNRLRKDVIPIFEDIKPGSSMRISSLSERINNYNHDKQVISQLALDSLKTPLGLCRLRFAKLPETVRTSLLAHWFRQLHVPSITAALFDELSKSIAKGKRPGSRCLPKGWQIIWTRDLIRLISSEKT